ncbi:MAG: NAD-dependent epimerase/dehydratase family protein [Nanoarchaeota archaeon]|nr:NAD-dependent epimerase/dehydratase family protein [Nanoarchaeota archaeon]MBU1135322.1 NAD-dependent epimerase/dehydratase family protein [Nanoarchaeota archaeon]MBU2520513.1 NAD-dependent epimerase/dehydratase family protein [Nanoarchaeota archaeon]
MLSDKNVLITGGYGFIGSNLVRHIVENSLAERIAVIDRVHSENSNKMERLNDIENKFTIIKEDIRNIKDSDKHFSDIDVIFHQAAFVSVPESIKKPSETIETNVMGTVKLLEACRKNDIERFVSASSAAVYGDQEIIPIKETAELKPTSPYGLSKLMAEDYCRIYSKLYGIKTVSLRYFNVYGPEQAFRRYPSVLSTLFHSMKDSKPFTIYGDGEQTRDYIHISDVVQANLLAASSKNLTKGEAVNIATGSTVSLNNLIKLVKDITNRDIEVSHSSPRKGDLLHSVADVSMAREALGFGAKVSIEDGLKKTCNLLLSSD